MAVESLSGKLEEVVGWCGKRSTVVNHEVKAWIVRMVWIRCHDISGIVCSLRHSFSSGDSHSKMRDMWCSPSIVSMMGLIQSQTARR